MPEKPGVVPQDRQGHHRSEMPFIRAQQPEPEIADEQLTELLWQSSDRWHKRLRSFPLLAEAEVALAPMTSVAE